MVICVEYKGKPGGIYIPRNNETFKDFVARVINTEKEQGRKINDDTYGMKFVFGKCSGPVISLDSAIG